MEDLSLPLSFFPKFLVTWDDAGRPRCVESMLWVLGPVSPCGSGPGLTLVYLSSAARRPPTVGLLVELLLRAA